eukprot:3659466-Pleurochrysis_carterae.AAC.1
MLQPTLAMAQSSKMVCGAAMGRTRKQRRIEDKSGIFSHVPVFPMTKLAARSHCRMRGAGSIPSTTHNGPAAAPATSAALKERCACAKQCSGCTGAQACACSCVRACERLCARVRLRPGVRFRACVPSL